jgi:hypothetical protein
MKKRRVLASKEAYRDGRFNTAWSHFPLVTGVWIERIFSTREEIFFLHA